MSTVNGWCIKAPNGTLLIGTFSAESATECMLRLEKRTKKDNVDWSELYRRGARCIPIEITETLPESSTP